ncbi:MAG: hypothetical protein K2X00_12395 [Nitrospiraceae bacterium]|nr:hypothetical protein [Nitrospiraceae bacterium]
MRALVFLKAVAFFLGLIVLAPRPDAYAVCADQDKSEPKKGDAEGESGRLTAMFLCGTYPELVNLVKEWRTELSEEMQKRILIALLQKLGSARPLNLREKDRIFVLSEQDSIAGNALPPDSAAGKIVVRHDILTEGGRAAWAIEKLLPCELPRVLSEMDDARRNALKEQAYALVISAMWIPDETAVAEAGDIRERLQLKLAIGRYTDRSVLSKLSKSRYVPVRTAVAANPRTLRVVLGQMLDDPSPQVRAAAEKSLQSARPY